MKKDVEKAVSKGEKLSNRVILFAYTLLNKLRLIKLFALIYCKGKENEI